MGKHYVPQYYLRGFSHPSNPKIITRYEKGSRQRPLTTQIKNVAQETRFYDPEIETFFANQIESPARAVLEKIRARESPTPDDKQAFSRYMTNLFKRVPQGQIRVKENFPRHRESVLGTLAACRRDSFPPNSI